MAFDAIAVKAVTTELANSLVGGRIEKIHQPERDEIVLIIRTFTKNYRLVLSASSAHPRIHLTSTQKQNPKTPPMFCMLLRKHLGSGKIKSITQEGFERVVKITIESFDELGDLTEKHLIIEIMGRHSNIILTTAEGRIIDCIKHIDLTISSVRELLPGITYTAPPKQEKPEFTSISDIDFDMSQGGRMMKKAVLESTSGISPICAAEIVYLVSGAADIRCGEVFDTAPYKTAMKNLSEKVSNNEFSPCLITEISTGKILDFSAINISQYGSLCEITHFESINEAMDAFYSGRDHAERMKQKGQSLKKLLTTAIERAAKKLIILRQTMSEAKNKEQYKIYADLITANIYRIEEKSKSVTVENFYEPDCPSITISLDPSKSPTANAQLYYKKYRKLKNAELEVTKQLEENQKNLDYLESTLVAVENAESEADLNAIKAELSDEGYIKRVSVKKAKKSEQKPIHFVSQDGFNIYIGKNNTQNDYLTLKFANSQDIWFHTKNIHGSHAIIKLELDKNVPESTMREAAEAAAYFSKARESSQVPVDYTTIKNVKKPNGAKPGMVIYDSYNTVYVTPKKPENID